jgi:hypothetical protein
VLGNVVDLITFKTLSQIDLDSNPLIAFPCGKHVLCVESADGLMGIDKVYEKDPETGEFTGTKSIVVSTQSFENKQVNLPLILFFNTSNLFNAFMTVIPFLDPVSFRLWHYISSLADNQAVWPSVEPADCSLQPAEVNAGTQPPAKVRGGEIDSMLRFWCGKWREDQTLCPDIQDH